MKHSSMAMAALIATMAVTHPHLMKDLSAQRERDDRTRPDPERLSKAEKKRARKNAHRLKCSGRNPGGAK